MSPTDRIINVPDTTEIPRVALADDRMVWLVVDGKLARREVDVAWRSADTVLVRGLRPGDAVVTTPLASPTEGMAVRVEGEAPALIAAVPAAPEHPLLSARPEAQRSVTYPWDSPGDGCWDSILRHVRRGFPLYRLMLVATDVADTVRREQIEGFDLDIHAAGDKAVGYLRPQGMPSAMAEQLAQHSITRPPRGVAVSRVVEQAGTGAVRRVLVTEGDDGETSIRPATEDEAAAMAAFDREVEYEMLGCSSCGRTDFGLALQRVQRMLANGDRGVEGYIAERLADGLREDAVANREHEAGLIDLDPPQEHETIAAMSHAMSLAGVELREAVARQVDAERALEEERRAAAGLRNRLRDAVHHLGTARDMTAELDVARYLTTAIDLAGMLNPQPRLPWAVRRAST